MKTPISKNSKSSSTNPPNPDLYHPAESGPGSPKLVNPCLPKRNPHKPDSPHWKNLIDHVSEYDKQMTRLEQVEKSMKLSKMANSLNEQVSLKRQLKGVEHSHENQ
jgi:hypothetical protein